MHILNTGTQLLQAQLTPDELAVRSQELARAVNNLAVEEDLQKSLRDQMKATLSECHATIHRLSTVVASGHEYRMVAVQATMLDTGQVEEVRLDTGEIVRTRPPYPEERQQTLDLKEAQP